MPSSATRSLPQTIKLERKLPECRVLEGCYASAVPVRRADEQYAAVLLEHSAKL
jgi:hypothetical protein